MSGALTLSSSLRQFLASHPAFDAELKSISASKPGIAKSEDLLNFARRLQSSGNLEGALEIYGDLLKSSDTPNEVRSSVQKEVEALEGKGSLGGRVEILLKQVLEESISPKVILPMMGASMVGALTKTIGMGRMLSAPASVLTRGQAAKWIAGTVGFAAEGLAFAGLGRAMRGKAEGSWGEEIARSYVGLGALKFSGWLGKGAAKWAGSSNSRWQRFQGLAVPQLTMFAGLTLAHHAETQLKLRPESKGDHWIADTLAAMISLQLGTKLGHAAMGEGYRVFHQELEQANEWSEGQLASYQWATPEGLDLGGPVWMAGEGRGRKTKAEAEKSTGSVESEGVLEIKGEFRFQDHNQWSEAEIGEIVQAIVAQDNALYPKGDVSPMSTANKYLKERRYRVGGKELVLGTLTGRVRQARGLKAGDSKSLSDAKVIEGWKRELFGWAPGESQALAISFDFNPSKLMTEEDIGRIVQAIVAQDKALYPKGDASPLSTSPKYLYERRYQVAGEELSLQTLIGRVRQARGLRAVDSKSLSQATVIEGWKRELFGWAPAASQALAITLDFKPSGRMTEEEIDRIVRAIVAQDWDLYPKGDASPMSTSAQYLSERRYQVAGEELSLQTLIGRVRQARGLRSDDSKSLSNATVIEGWKRELFCWEAPETIPKENLAIALDFQPSERMTEEEIDRIVRAIVAQDWDLYPKGDVSPMSTSAQYLNERRYRVGGKELVLGTLIGRVRQARGLKAGDSKSLSDATVIEGWKRELFGWAPVESQALVINLDFKPSERMTEEEVGRIVKAIVAQDGELYPKGEASPMSTSAQYLKERRYQVAGEELSLQTLIGRVRQARGLRSDDSKSLSLATVIEGWKRELFGWAPAKSLALAITLDFNPSARMTEEEIGRIVKAIVAQDKALYPKGEASPMVTSAQYLSERRYQVAGEELSLKTLIGRVRQARGLRAGDSKSLSQATVIEGWKRDLFGKQSFNSQQPEQIEAYIKKHQLSDLLGLFGSETHLLAEALPFLKSEAFPHREASEFVRAYVGLKVASGKGRGAVAVPQNPRDGYLRALLQALESQQSLDLSAESQARQTQLLIRMSRASFEADPKGVILDLEARAEEAQHPFLKGMLQDTVAYFRANQNFEVKGMHRALYGYQREGARFLATHDRAILADEAGMGKTIQGIAAVESLGLKKVLWVTTASNKESLREEIHGHSSVPLDAVKVLVSGDPKERSRQLSSLNGERYLIANYESLVALKRDDPEGFNKLTGDLDALIVDEAQLVDNPEALRSQAVQGIEAKRRWLLSATPYQNKPENLYSLLHWLHPERYSDPKAFRELYIESSEGLATLHHEMRDFTLRRTRRETLSYFSDPKERSFAEQLKDGIPKLPKLKRIAPEVAGSYALSPEQAEAIAQMTGDFESWAEQHGLAQSQLNPLQKFDYIHRAIYNPESLGIGGENPLYKALDQVVQERMERGEKVILWAWNTKVLDELQRRYQHHGLRRIDGDVKDEARDRARHEFQELSAVKIMVANYESGGVGLTLSAANSDIFVQLPLSFPKIYQASARKQRLIGPDNVRHAKEQVEELWMLPKFPEGFVESLESEELGQILSHGTLVEQTRQRLEGGEQLYNLVMEGIGDIDQLEREFKAGLIEGMGLNRKDKLSVSSRLQGKARQEAATAEFLMPLWQQAKTQGPEAETQALRLIEALRYYPETAKEIGRVYQEGLEISSEALSGMVSVVQVPNKYLREQLLKELPGLLKQQKLVGKSAVSIAAQLETNAEVRSLYQKLNEALSTQRQTPNRRFLEEHLLYGILGVRKTSEVVELFRAHPELSQLPLERQVQAIYRVGLLSKSRPDLLKEINQHPGDISKSLENGVKQAIGELAFGDEKNVTELLRQSEAWRDNADPLLALWNGYLEVNNGTGERLRSQYKEILEHLLLGDYKAWRNEESYRSSGEAIEYLSEETSFWKEFTKGRKKEIAKVTIGQSDRRIALLEEYVSIEDESENLLSNLRSRKQESWLKEWESDSQVIGKALQGEPIDSQQIGQALQRLESISRDLGHPDVADRLESLGRSLSQLSTKDREYKKLSIEDTDDPGILVRMGALHPELTNCFNPNANPIFHQHILAALGSRNMRMIVVKEQGKVIAIAMLKVKQLEDGTPVLFLENGLSRSGYDFRKEMLAHAEELAKSLHPQPKVMEQIRGKAKPTDPTVYGTGSYTGTEYVEPVFALRDADQVSHKGRLVEKKSLGPSIGIGTSNKTIAAYLQELESQGVRIVVDVRANPVSQWFPHFNRKTLADSLAKAGIQYLWMGDTLGNPKDAAGQRSLAGFKRHMTSEAYARGMQQLRRLIQSQEGRVAITCSEGKECDCHRQFILADLKDKQP